MATSSAWNISSGGYGKGIPTTFPELLEDNRNSVERATLASCQHTDFEVFILPIGIKFYSPLAKYEWYLEFIFRVLVIMVSLEVSCCLLYIWRDIF